MACKTTGCWFVGGDDLTAALHDLAPVVQLSPPPPSSSRPSSWFSGPLCGRQGNGRNRKERERWKAKGRRATSFFTIERLCTAVTSQHLEARSIRQIECDVHRGRGDQVAHCRHDKQEPLRHRNRHGNATLDRPPSPDPVHDEAEKFSDEHSTCLQSNDRLISISQPNFLRTTRVSK